MQLAQLLAFSHFALYPQENWALLVLIPICVSFCMSQDPVGLSNKLSCEALVSPATSTPQIFSVSGFEALFPHARSLVSVICLAPQLFLTVYLHTNVGLPSPPAAALLSILSAQLPISAPPTGLNECFFFNSSVVGLHAVRFCGSSGCFLFLNLLLSFFLLRKEVKYIYLHLHLGQKSLFLFMLL